jgi:hypothetical protein
MQRHFQSVVALLCEKSDLERALALAPVMAKNFDDWEIVLVFKENPSLSFADIQEALNRKSTVNTRTIFLAGKDLSDLTALWRGIDSCIGDRTTALFQFPTSTSELETFWRSAKDFDVYFGYPAKESRSLTWSAIANKAFSYAYRTFAKTNLEGTQVGVIDFSRNFVNYLQKTRRPEISLRNSNLFQGFSTSSTTMKSLITFRRTSLTSSFGRAMEILFSASSAPLRIVSTLALCGAGLNVAYSIYVLAVSATLKVTPGWTSMSLQISGMFLLVSLVLSLMCEFLIFLYRATGGPQDSFIVREVNSRFEGLRNQLNVDDGSDNK